jgi:endonuclease G
VIRAIKIRCLLLVLGLLYGSLGAQVRYDTVIDLGIYKSYFSTAIRQPVAVVYRLYEGGGAASRDNDRFRGTELTLKNKDYARSGYDRGHLVPAEDFAYSDSLQAITFSYYNCVPQTPRLNRGKWKVYEEQVRRLSRTDTIQVVCYNVYGSVRKGRLWIPEVCYKSVYSRTGTLLLSVALCNDEEGGETPPERSALEFMDSLVRRPEASHPSPDDPGAAPPDQER